MSDLRQAAQQALEALELLQNAIYNIGGEHVTGWGYANDAADSAEKPITALRAALAQQAEPVAWLTEDCSRVLTHKTKSALMRDGGAAATSMAPFCVPAYTAPPRREWLSLTDEQLRKLYHEDQFGLFCDYDEFEQIARAIEVACKEKNHG
jgi:hypothetical protein